MPGAQGAAAPRGPAKMGRRDVVDIDFADPQTVRLNSPMGAPHALDDPEVLAARLREAHRLRAEQSVGGRAQSAKSSATPGGRWRVQDFGKHGDDASALNELAGVLQEGYDQERAQMAAGASSLPLRFPVPGRLVRQSTWAAGARGGPSVDGSGPMPDRMSVSPDRRRPPLGSQSVGPRTSRIRQQSDRRSVSPDSLRPPLDSPSVGPQRSIFSGRPVSGSMKRNSKPPPALVRQRSRSESPDPKLRLPLGSQFVTPLTSSSSKESEHWQLPPRHDKPQRPLSARPAAGRNAERTACYTSPYASLIANSQRPLSARRPTPRRPSPVRLSSESRDALFANGHRPTVPHEPAIPRGMESASPAGLGRLQRRHAMHLNCTWSESEGEADPDPGGQGHAHVNSSLAHGSFKQVYNSGENSADAGLLVKQSWAYAMAGRFDAALRCAENACKIQEDNPEVHLRIAKACQGLKKWSRADTAIKRGQELSPDDPNLELCYREIKLPLLKERGFKLMQASQPDEAIAAFSEALAIPDISEDDKYWLLMNRCRVYMSKNDMASAAEDASLSIRIRPNAVEAYERYVDSLVALGDLDAARQAAHIGLMHSVNHQNEVLTNILDRIAMGTMPKVSASRIFVKQILKPEEDESVHEVPRLIRVWDRRLKKDMYPKVLEYWTKTLQDIMPEMQNSTGTPTTTTAASVSGAGLQSRHNASSTSLATHLTRQLSLMGSSTKSMDFSRSQSCNTSVYSSDDLKDKLNKVVYICKEFFKFAEAKNKELFLRMSVAGWKAMSSVLPEDNPLAMVALQLQVGYAYLHAFEFVETQRGFTEERECIKCFEQCLGQLQRDEFYMQRAGAWFGLAQAYKNRREGNHIENLLRSASYLRDFLSVCTFEVDPHRCIAAHQEIGDIYIEAGKIQLANEFLVSALNHLKDSDGTGWNTLAGVKFLRAHIHCKLAEACEKAKAGRDPEKDPEYQAQVKKGIDNYEVPAP